MSPARQPLCARPYQRIAALAQHEGRTTLHHDCDLDLITGITGRWTRRVAEPGTAD
ncbi:hypothetical protein ACFU5O_10370 [Streptomyces sp. NPDC057445]|uniref:hypothetical protein n=1 Tax=Streptomyces sp. NPDC057445 TaxID=3346136 RepID=UPI00369C98A3